MGLSEGRCHRPTHVDASRTHLRAELAIVIVEHNLDLVLALADRASMLERGSVVHQGAAAALRENLELRRQVLWI